MPGPLDASRRTLSRRTLLAGGGALGLVAVGACSLSSDVVEVPGEGATAARGVSSDVRLATRALTEVREAREAVAATRRRFPGRSGELAGLESMHDTHTAALVDAVPDEAEVPGAAVPYDVPPRPGPALERLRRHEERLLGRLEEMAVRAESGAFASLLASMGAGVAQRVASWPT